MKLCSCEAMKLWNHWTVELWSYAAMRLWSYAAVKLWSYEAMKLRRYEAIKQWSYEAMKLWSYEAVKLRSYHATKYLSHNVALSAAGLLAASGRFSTFLRLVYLYENLFKTTDFLLEWPHRSPWSIQPTLINDFRGSSLFGRTCIICICSHITYLGHPQ